MNFILRLYIPSSGSSDSQWQLKPLPPGASTQCFLFHLLLTAGHTSPFFPMTAIQIFEDNQILQAINILMLNDPLRKVRVLSLFWFEHTLKFLFLYKQGAQHCTQFSWCESETTVCSYILLLLREPNVELPVWLSHHTVSSC